MVCVTTLCISKKKGQSRRNKKKRSPTGCTHRERCHSNSSENAASIAGVVRTLLFGQSDCVAENHPLYNLLSYLCTPYSCASVWFTWLGLSWDETVCYITTAANFNGEEEAGVVCVLGGDEPSSLFIQLLMLCRISWLHPFCLRERVCLPANQGKNAIFLL